MKRHHSPGGAAALVPDPEMTDPRTEAPETPDVEDVDAEPSPFRVALGFFILPLLLVIIGVGVFLLFGVLAHDATHPSEYLQQINGRGINEPWQAAFHLSQALQFDESLRGDRAFAEQVVATLERAENDDPRVRRFLAIALGRIEHEAAVPALVSLVDDPDTEVRVNAMWALGNIGAIEAADRIAGELRDDDSSIRMMAGYVLGVLEQSSTAPALQVALNDPIPAVRWNAAVALGMMGDPAGYEQLARMIDREHLAGVPGVDPSQHGDTMLAALRALQELGAGGLEQELIDLRDTDPDLRVREAARRALGAPGGAAAALSTSPTSGAQ